MASQLQPGEKLAVGASLMSPGERYTLTLQTDGNLVIYDEQEHHLAIWSSATNGKAVDHAIMQTDGNFVIYGFPQALWATNTVGQPGAFLVLQDDGHLAIIQFFKQALWSAGTQGQ